MNKKFIGNLFIVDRYVTPGHEHISIRDGYEFYSCYKQGAYAGTAMPDRPYDPEEHDGGIVLE